MTDSITLLGAAAFDGGITEEQRDQIDLPGSTAITLADLELVGPGKGGGE